MPVNLEWRGDDRRSPVGAFLLGTLVERGETPLAYAELLQIARGRGLNISTVLAWASRAEEAGVIEQLSGPDGESRSLRLTAYGAELARNDRRGRLRRV
ncbi:MAG TPA: hypothetical protein VG474_05385 [Solirubrobacteraceae bacterium]|nr:hypothetical protein [Solirubrobacteraceae bacterium]